MVTIGDSFSVVAVLCGLSVTIWALIACFALLFPDRVVRAKKAVDSGVWPNIGAGLLWLIPLVIGAVMLKSPNGPGKLLGFGILMATMAVAAIGAAGITAVAAGNLKRMSPDLADSTAFLRSAGLLVGAGMLPVFGWFVVWPVVLLVSLGAGTRSIMRRSVPPVVATVTG